MTGWFVRIAADFRAAWRRLLWVHLLAGALYVLILTPLYSSLVGWLVLASGDVALTDEDILHFVLSPLGGVIFLLAATAGAFLLVLEQGGLILSASDAAFRGLGGLRALGRRLVTRSPVLFRLALRLVLRLSLVSLPMLVLVLAVYRGLLGAYDINYYLALRPPEFWQALAMASVGGVLTAVAWFRILAIHLAALPAALLGPAARARDLVRAVRGAPRAQRRRLDLFLLAWAAAAALLLGLAGLVLEQGAAWSVRWSGQSLQGLVLLMGLVILAWALTHFLATFLAGCGLAIGLLHAYRVRDPSVQAGMTYSTPAAKSGPAWAWAGPAVLLALLVAAGLVLREVDARRHAGSDMSVIAHRGASAEAPENTLAAIRLAVEQGADWVEIDVQQTSDNRIAVVHDSDLMKLAGVPLKVRNATLSELQSVDIGSAAGPGFAGEHVPSLEQVIDEVGGRSGLLIELKYYGGERGFEQQVASVLDRAEAPVRFKLMSLNLSGARAMKALRPDWEVGLLSSVGMGDLRRLDVDFLAVNARLATRSFVRRLQAAGRPVYAWTINDPALMSTMAGRELDGIITDRPGLARQVLAERAQLDLHELLLINLASLAGSRLDEAQ